MEKILILLITALINFSCYAQQIKPIIQTAKYSQDVSSGNDNYYFLGKYFIDPEDKGIIDLKSLKKGIDRVVKDTNYSEYIILDIENKVYQELRRGTIEHENYTKNINMFVGMVEMVKALRPKAKVGVYGFPFNFNYASQKKNNDFEKLMPLLEKVDFFAPQLYLYFTEKERSEDFFDNYIAGNLGLYFEYAHKLDKKVYPFFWYKIHPYNKKHGGDVMDANQYSAYLRRIEDFRYKNRKVEKIIYWEPAIRTIDKKTIDIDEKLTETIKLLR